MAKRPNGPQAVLIAGGRPIAQVFTARPAGDLVWYSFDPPAHAMCGQEPHVVGRAKISRARKWLGNPELLLSLPAVTIVIDRVGSVVARGGDPDAR